MSPISESIDVSGCRSRVSNWNHWNNCELWKLVKFCDEINVILTNGRKKGGSFHWFSSLLAAPLTEHIFRGCRDKETVYVASLLLTSRSILWMELHSQDASNGRKIQFKISKVWCRSLFTKVSPPFPKMVIMKELSVIALRSVWGSHKALVKNII